ncbi:uncharacterized protein [Nicotiana sylvestris]|uniref:uncharacterized protein n=1 Tax=Nicotiana sylvestris TaxID=4096 RepID=UPI00388CE278
MHIDELEQAEKSGWKLFFDGATNMKGVGIGAVLISETGQHYPVTARLHFYCTNNMAEYEASILGLRLGVDMGVREVLVMGDSDLLVHQIQGEWETRDLTLIPYRQCLHELCQRFQAIEFRHIPRIHNEVADALATLALMLHHPDKAYVDPLQIQVRDQHAYCNVIEEEIDGEPWFHDIKEYIKAGVYPTQATGDQKRTVRRLAIGFFLSGGGYSSASFGRSGQKGLQSSLSASGIVKHNVVRACQKQHDVNGIGEVAGSCIGRILGKCYGNVKVQAKGSER